MVDEIGSSGIGKSNWDVYMMYFSAMIGPILYNILNMNEGGGLLLFALFPFLLIAVLAFAVIVIARTIFYKLRWTRILWIGPIVLFYEVIIISQNYS